MAHQWGDRVAETTTTTGTGALTLAGAITGYRRFSAICSVGDTVIYAMEAVDGSGVPTGDWEEGVGTYSATNTLTRTTVLKSSNSDTAVTLTSGTKNVFLDDIASTRNTLQEYTGAQSTNQPSAPIAGSILWSQDRNGWSVAMQRGVNGISIPVNPFAPGRAGISVMLPSSGDTVATGIGCTATSSNTVAVLRDGTTLYGSAPWVGASTTTTASTAATIRTSTSVVPFRGSSALSGFHLAMVFGLNTIGNTNCRWFVGLNTSTATLAATYDPAATANLQIGVGATGTDTTNAKLYYANGTVSNSVDLGTSFPAKTAKAGINCLELWSAGSGTTTIFYRVWRLDDLTIAPVSGSISSNLPAAGNMYAHWAINNNATAALSTLAQGSAYFEVGV